MILSDFPSLAATEYKDRLPGLIAQIEKYEEDRFLLKAWADEIKFTLNRAVEAAFENLFERCEYQRAGSYQPPLFGGVALTEKEGELDSAYTYSCATIAGKAKRLEKLPASPFRDATLALIAEINPLVETCNGLKAFIGKKAPKVDPVLAYQAPAASRVAAKAVYDALELVVEANYQSLVAYFVGQLKGVVKRFQEAQPISIYDYTVIRDEHGRYVNFQPVRDTLIELCKTVPGLLHKVGPTIAADVDARIQKSAVESATYQKQTFLYKNMTKMDSILEARGDFDNVHVIEQSPSLLEASIGVFFKNGDKFVARTQIVNVWNAHLPFSRYPLTFHGISLAGKSHAMFSEQEMNTVFTKA